MPFKKFLNKNNKENIAIIGHMGSGKTLFGKKIAHYFNIEHIDIDREISKYENSTINNIFLSKGEIYFRKIETLIALNILEKKKCYNFSWGGINLK